MYGEGNWAPPISQRASSQVNDGGLRSAALFFAHRAVMADKALRGAGRAYDEMLAATTGMSRELLLGMSNDPLKLLIGGAIMFNRMSQLPGEMRDALVQEWDKNGVMGPVDALNPMTRVYQHGWMAIQAYSVQQLRRLRLLQHIPQRRGDGHRDGGQGSRLARQADSHPDAHRLQSGMVARLRAGIDVIVRDVDEARALLANMPEVRPFNSAQYPLFQPAPRGTFRGDLMNTADPAAPFVHPPGSAPPSHGLNPHYNIYFPSGQKAAIIIVP